MIADPTTAALSATYNFSLWSGLAAAGVNFVPVDLNSVLSAVRGNAAFGFTATGPACTQPAGVASGWAAPCSPTSSVSTLVSPDAAQTHLFADNLHLSTAGQKIVADYEYSLIVAPSMISMMAEAPVKTRLGLVGIIDNQIPISQRQHGPSGTNGWISGDVSSLKIDNPPGFPGDPGTPVSAVVGVDHKFADGLLVGLVFSAERRRPGSRTISGVSGRTSCVSGDAARYFGQAWLRLIGTYGTLRYDLHRTVPIGIAVMPNNASVGGRDVSIATNGGYDFVQGPVTHGLSSA